MEQAMEQSGEGDGGDPLIATAIAEAGARLALAVLRGLRLLRRTWATRRRWRKSWPKVA